MAEGTLAGAARSSWLEPVESRPWGSLALGLALSTLLVLGMLAWWAVFGLWHTLFDPQQPFGISFDARSHLTLAVLLGFVTIAIRWVRREELRDLQALEPASSLPAELFAEQVRRISVRSNGARIFSISAAILIGVVMILLTRAKPGNLFEPARWNAHHLWALANNALIFALMIDAAFGTVAGWKALDSISHSLRDLDLLDRKTVGRIGGYGLPGAIIWLVGTTLASSLAWGMRNVWPLLAVLCVSLGLATLSMLRPAQIVHRRLRDAKRTELERVRAKIAGAKEAALLADSDAASLLPGLLAYEARIESVREWPFDTPTLLRFAVVALIAMGSWLGGAIVERVLGAFLG